MTFTITISLINILVFWFIVQVIFFVIGLINGFILPEVTCPIFWFLARIIYILIILCRGDRYTYNYTTLYSEDGKVIGYKKFRKWFSKSELNSVYEYRKNIEENHNDLIK